MWKRMPEKERGMRDALEAALRFFQTRVDNHFCGFCRNANFYHRDTCPVPQIYKALGMVQTEAKHG